MSSNIVSDALPASEHDTDAPALSLEIQPTGACWVSAARGRAMVLYRLLEPGERFTATAQKELLFASATRRCSNTRVNGIMGRPLGEPRRPVTIEITPDNYETYLDTNAALRAISST